MSKILGLAGPSCSGKGTVARILATKHEAKLFNLDSYWIKGSNKPVINGYKSYERPDQYDGASMARDILAFRAGSPEQPIVAEGFLLFNYPEMLEVCGVKVFLDISQTLIAMRRAQRALSLGETIEAGGRIASVEDAWLANGLEEWMVWGVSQKNLVGMKVISANLDPNSLAEKVEEAWISN